MRHLALLLVLLTIAGCNKTIHEVKLPIAPPLAVSR
jgi:hypothetical protein